MQSIKTAKLVMGGWLSHYNHFRPHEFLKGKTPGEMAKSTYPFTSWIEVAKEGWIDTEKKGRTRVPT